MNSSSSGSQPIGEESQKHSNKDRSENKQDDVRFPFFTHSRKNYQEAIDAARNSVADENWKGAILFGFFTGIRLRNIIGLRWRNVTADSGCIKFVAGKTTRT